MKLRLTILMLAVVAAIAMAGAQSIEVINKAKEKYDYVGDAFSSEGLAAVELNGKWGFVSTTGEEIMPCKYDMVYCFLEGLAQVKLNGKMGFVDERGQEVVSCKYDQADPFEDGVARVILNGKSFLIDKNGNEVDE